MQVACAFLTSQRHEHTNSSFGKQKAPHYTLTGWTPPSADWADWSSDWIVQKWVLLQHFMHKNSLHLTDSPIEYLTGWVILMVQSVVLLYGPTWQITQKILSSIKTNQPTKQTKPTNLVSNQKISSGITSWTKQRSVQCQTESNCQNIIVYRTFCV